MQMVNGQHTICIIYCTMHIVSCRLHITYGALTMLDGRDGSPIVAPSQPPGYPIFATPSPSQPAIYQTLPLGSKRFHFFSNQIKINGFKTPGSIFIWFLSENKRTQKARKEKGTSLASLPSQTTHPRTLSIYWTYQCFCTIKKQVALTGNKN